MKLLNILSLSLMLTVTVLVAGEVKNDPAQCFAYYGQLDRNSDAAYAKTLSKCWNDAGLGRVSVDESTKDSRSEIETTVEKSDAALSACNQYKDPLNYFACNTQAPDEKAMFRIKQIATQVHDRISEEYRVIEVTEQRCQQAADNKHNQEKYNILQEKNDCIYNRKPLPEEPTEPTVGPGEPTSPTYPETEEPEPEPESLNIVNRRRFSPKLL